MDYIELDYDSKPVNTTLLINCLGLFYIISEIIYVLQATEIQKTAIKGNFEREKHIIAAEKTTEFGTITCMAILELMCEQI